MSCSFFSSESCYQCLHGPNGCLVPSRPAEGQSNLEYQFDELESKLKSLAKKRSGEIEKFLEEQKRQDEGITNILILGGPSSGKSTIFKQMQIIHRDGFKRTDELEQFKELIHQNIHDIFLQLMNGAKILGIGLENIEINSMLISEEYSTAQQLNEEVAKKLKVFWKSEQIQKVFARRYEFELMDSTKYFLENIDRIGAQGYCPNHEDIVHSRRPTKHIHSILFTYNNLRLRMTDVGGQKSERRKWLHLFEDARVILFVVDLTGCAKKSEESRLEIIRSKIFQKYWENPGNVSDMKVALRIFEDVSTNLMLKNAVFLVFFNKVDLFEEILNTYGLGKCFSKYKGTNDILESSQFVKDKFIKIAKSRKSIYPHFTTATNTENIKMVFRACMESVFKANSRSTGLS